MEVGVEASEAQTARATAQPTEAMATPARLNPGAELSQLQLQVHHFLTQHIPLALEDVRRMQAEEKRRQQHQEEQAQVGHPPLHQQQQQQMALQEALQQSPAGSNDQEPNITPSSSAMLILFRTRQQAAALLEQLLRHSLQEQQQLEQQIQQQEIQQQNQWQQEQHQKEEQQTLPLLQGQAVDDSLASQQEEQVKQLKETLAALDYRMGSIASEAGDTTLAGKFFSSALQLWSSLPMPLGAKGGASRVAMTLDVCNILASMALDQGLHQVAEGLLLRSHSFYEQFNAESVAWSSARGSGAESSSSASAPSSMSVDGGGSTTGNAEGVESQYTFTCFHLAQVYAALDQRAKSAYFCGLTLTRQLRLRHHFTPLEWVQNCTQLASYYAGTANLPCALRCLSASKAILEAEGSSLREPGQAEARAVAGANIAAATGRIFMKVLQDSVERSVKEQEAQQPQGNAIQPPSSTNSSPQASGDAMDTDSSAVGHGPPATPGAATVANGTQDGRESAGASDSYGAIEAAVTRGPDFSPLGVSLGGATRLLVGETPAGMGGGSASQKPDEAKLLEGVGDYPGAVVLFNRAMVNFKAALELYTADERFTDHVLLVLNISNLHKHLAYFEVSAHRAALIYLRGISRLESLIPRVNPKIYPQQVKQLAYEIASVHLSVMSLEEEAGRPLPKIQETYLKAIAFLESLVQLIGPNHQTVQPDFHQLFSNAVFLLASIHHRHHKLLHPQTSDNKRAVPSPPAHPSQVLAETQPQLHKSLQLFSYFLQCVEEFQLEELLKEKVALAHEMIQLVPATLEMQLKNLSLS